MGTWETSIDSGIALIKTSGEIDLGDFRELMRLMAGIEGELEITRFLIDNSDSTFTLSTTEIYGLPKDAKQLGLKRICVFALVFPFPTLDSNFMEIIAKNTGFTARVFKTTTEALSWLRSLRS